jgi:DNA polymerase-3 subunit gamma/tau
MAVLTRNWQMLLKGLGEIEQAPDARQAAEMLFIRLAYASELPDPAEAIRNLTDAPAQGGAPQGGRPQGGGNGGGGGTATAQALQPSIETEAVPASAPRACNSIEDVIAILSENREGVLASQVRNWVRPVSVAMGRIECRFSQDAPADIANRLSAALRKYTDQSWLITVATDEATALPSVTEARDAEQKKRFEEAAAHPTIAAILSAFPGAEIESVKDILPETEPVDPDADNAPIDEEDPMEGDL